MVGEAQVDCEVVLIGSELHDFHSRMRNRFNVPNVHLLLIYYQHCRDLKQQLKGEDVR